MGKGQTYKPNEIPLTDRVSHSLLAAGLLVVGVWGLLDDDIPIRVRGAPFEFHMHGLSAWLLFISLLAFCALSASTVMDHYDRRDNERHYQIFARRAGYVGWIFLWLAFVWYLVSGGA